MPEKVSFAEIMNMYLRSENLTFERLQDMLAENGSDIKSRRLSEYSRQVCTPSYERARDILNALGVQFTDEELTGYLVTSREQVAQRRNPSSLERGTEGIGRKRKKNVIIELDSLIPGKPYEQVELMIEERMKLMYEGDNTKFSTYIMDLLRKDLEENG